MLLLQGSFLRFIFIFEVVGVLVCMYVHRSAVLAGLPIQEVTSHTLWHWAVKDSSSILKCCIRLALGTRKGLNTENKEPKA